MAFLQVKNNASSILASGITDVATSLSVASGEGARFPASNFHITIEDEILKCTTRAGDVLTVTRAQEGTAAAAHATGKAVRLNITAAIITELQDLTNISCQVTHNADQSILNATGTSLAFNTENWDTDLIHNPADNTKLTCTKAGKYLVMCAATFAGNATGVRVGWLRKGGVIIADFRAAPVSTHYCTVFPVALLNLAIGDVLDLQVYQDSGGALNVLTASYSPFFTMMRLAL